MISFLHAPCHSCPGLSEAQEDQKMLHVLRSNKRVTVAQITGKPQEAHTAGPVKKLMDSSQSHLSIRAICDIHKRMQAAWGSGQCSAAITLLKCTIFLNTFMAVANVRICSTSPQGNQKWFHNRDKDFSVFTWPHKSLNVNEIEHLWDVLQKHDQFITGAGQNRLWKRARE